MEGFTQLLRHKISTSCFTFHLKCEQVGLSSLALVDDLFILSKAGPQSIKTNKDALDKFQSLYGLQFNTQKCEIYTSGINT